MKVKEKFVRKKGEREKQNERGEKRRERMRVQKWKKKGEASQEERKTNGRRVQNFLVGVSLMLDDLGRGAGGAGELNLILDCSTLELP